MTTPTHEAQQVAIKMIWGFPVLMVRKSYPVEGYSWEWTRWRRAKWNEANTINLILMDTWKE